MRSLVGYIVVLLLVVALVGCNCPPSTMPNSNANANTNSNSNTSASTGQYATADQALEAGLYYLENGETEKAIAAFNEAVALDPTLADAYFQLGITYALLETQNAGEMATPTPAPATPAPSDTAGSSSTPKPQATPAVPTKTNSQIYFEKAVEAYKAKIAANPEDASSYYGLGRSQNKLNQDEDAKKALQEAVKKNPENVEYIIAYAAILMKLAQYPEAVAQLKTAIALDPENSEALGRLEDAEAGRSRVTYSPSPKPSPTKSPVANTANTNSSTPVTNMQRPPRTPIPATTPAKPPTNQP